MIDRRSFLAKLAGVVAAAFASRLPAAEAKKPAVIYGSDLTVWSGGRQVYPVNGRGRWFGKSNDYVFVNGHLVPDVVHGRVFADGTGYVWSTAIIRRPGFEYAARDMGGRNINAMLGRGKGQSIFRYDGKIEFRPKHTVSTVVDYDTQAEMGR